MQSMEEIIEHDRVIVRTCLLSDIIYLIIHILYLIFFFITNMFVLAYINIGSILCYILFFFVVRAKKYKLYALLCGFEIFSYMTAATILCGMSSGFYLVLIGLCIVSFYSSYFSKTHNHKEIPIVWSAITFADFVFMVLYCRFINNNTYYNPEPWIVTTLFIIHALFTFSLVVVYLYSFTQYALKLEQSIRKAYQTDRLTGIANRYALYNYLNKLEDKSNYLLSIFDIDDFKVINDTNGHIYGDYILREISTIANNNSSDDFVSRYGGEEFIVISKISNNYKDTIDKIDNIRRKIEEYNFRFDNKNVKATVTIGVAKYSDNLSIDEWINIADNNLYKGKSNGKNQIVD